MAIFHLKRSHILGTLKNGAILHGTMQIAAAAAENRVNLVHLVPNG